MGVEQVATVILMFVVVEVRTNVKYDRNLKWLTIIWIHTLGGSSYTFNCLSDVYTESGTTDANDLTTGQIVSLYGRRSKIIQSINIYLN